MIKNTGREVYLSGIGVKAAESIGLNTLVGIRDDDGYLEQYDPASIVASAYAYNIVGVAIAPITGGTNDGDVETDKDVVVGCLLKMDTNADIALVDQGKQVYGEDASTAKEAAVADGNIIGVLWEYLGGNEGYVLVEPQG